MLDEACVRSQPARPARRQVAYHGHMGTTSLGPEEYLEALGAVARVLESHAGALDELHRQPSADGRLPAAPGAGADLAATVEAALQAAAGCADYSSVSSALVEGARRGCSGRSGKDLVTVLMGLADVFRNADRVDGNRFALGLEASAERFAPSDTGGDPGGFAAVLTVAADSALSAADRGAELAEVVLEAADGGLEELERGPEANPRLAMRGVVDAGAAGFLLMLDTLAGVVAGEPLPTPPEPRTAGSTPRTDGPAYHLGCELAGGGDLLERPALIREELLDLVEHLELRDGSAGLVISLETRRPGEVVEVLIGHGTPRELDIHVLDTTWAAGGAAPGRLKAVDAAG